MGANLINAFFVFIGKDKNFCLNALLANCIDFIL